mmetsp:Transcript_38178/g.107876  ORF Transcript_38178/g.107876 Transcript_38178/m.107876 type:complete len:237 (-) Transcript_38178:1262-1972(-)
MWPWQHSKLAPRNQLRGNVLHSIGPGDSTNSHGQRDEAHWSPHSVCSCLQSGCGALPGRLNSQWPKYSNMATATWTVDRRASQTKSCGSETTTVTHPMANSKRFWRLACTPLTMPRRSSSTSVWICCVTARSKVHRPHLESMRKPNARYRSSLPPCGPQLILNMKMVATTRQDTCKKMPSPPAAFAPSTAWSAGKENVDRTETEAPIPRKALISASLIPCHLRYDVMMRPSDITLK